jgi:hypothetical protein
MSVTFSELKNRTIFAIGDDPDVSTDVPDELLIDACYAALDAILPHCWKPSTSVLTGSAASYLLPTDIFEAQGVWDSSKDTFLDPAVITPGEPSASQTGNGWFLYPYGYVSLYTALSSSGGVLYYSAVWDKPTTDAESIEAPEYATTGLAMYAASYVLLMRIGAQARLGNYKTRIDSGSPTDNPLLDYSTYLLKRFDIEMSRLPQMVKGVR